MPETLSQPRPSWKQRIKSLFEQYGSMAIVVFIAVSAIAFGVAYVLVSTIGMDRVAGIFGWEVSKTAETASTWGASYVVYRLMLPLRIGATAVLLPVVAKLVSVVRARRG